MIHFYSSVMGDTNESLKSGDIYKVAHKCHGALSNLVAKLTWWLGIKAKKCHSNMVELWGFGEVAWWLGALVAYCLSGAAANWSIQLPGFYPDCKKKELHTYLASFVIISPSNLSRKADSNNY